MALVRANVDVAGHRRGDVFRVEANDLLAKRAASGTVTVLESPQTLTGSAAPAPDPSELIDVEREGDDQPAGDSAASRD